MLRGDLAVTGEERLVAISLLTGERRALSDAELRLLSGVASTHWVALDDLRRTHGVTDEMIAPLLDAGLLLADPATGRHAELRAREERFAAIDWDDHAAQYHVMSRMKDQDVGRFVEHAAPVPVDAGASSQARVQEYVELATAMSQTLVAGAATHDPPPPHFYRRPDAVATHDLPDPRVEAPLFDLLTARKTIRLFDHENPLTIGELSTILYYTFGAQGWAQLVPGLVGLRKTSPSGGSLHPIEAYPLVMNVRGADPGLYHYSVERHAVELLQPMERERAQSMAEILTLGQSYFRSAHVLIILTARWYRNFWKYRKAPKSYRVIHVDAGHLSQTLYLVCQHLGLGAFFTGAVNDVNVEELLKLDPLQEGVVGISGCGRPLNGGAPLTLQTVPYTVPR